MSEDELENLTQPSESIIYLSNVRLYKNEYGKSKIDFCWDSLKYPVKGISLTDQDFYDKLDKEDIYFDKAIIIVPIPKDASWVSPNNDGEKRAYKFMSKVYEIIL